MAGRKEQSSAVSSVSNIATDLSRRTEATSFSVPDDGRVVTISTNPRRRNPNNPTTADQLASASQTSLLIEYFESGKKDKSKNVRVKVTPSRRSKSKADGGSKLTDDVRSQRSTASPNMLGEVLEGRRRDSLNDGMSSPSFVSDNSVQPLNFAFKGQNRGSPSSVASREIELGSDTARARTRANVRAASKARKEDYYGLKSPSGQVRSRSISRESYLTEDGGLKPVSAKLNRRRSRSLSRDRLSPADAKPEKPRKGVNRGYEPGDRYRKGRSRSRSHSRDRSGDSYDPKNDLKKGDAGLTKKGESNVTYDPNMLDLVEDAIKRIIQPQIQELKKQTNEAVFNAHTSEISATTAPKFGGQLGKPFKINSMPEVKPIVVFTPDFDRGKGQGFVVAKAHDSKDSLSDATTRAPGFGPSFKNTGRTLHSEVGEGDRDEIVPLSFNSDVSTNVPRGRPDALDIPTWGGLDPPASRKSLPAQMGLPYPRNGKDNAEMPRTGGTPTQQSLQPPSRPASVSSMSSLPTDIGNKRREKAGKQQQQEQNSREIDTYLDHAQSTQQLGTSLGTSNRFDTTEFGGSKINDDRSLLSIGDMTDVQSTNLAQQQRGGDKSVLDDDDYTVDGSHLDGDRSNLDVGGSSLMPPQSERQFRDDESNFTADYDEYHSDLSERNPNNPYNTLNQQAGNTNPAVQAFFAEQRQVVEQEAMLIGAQHGGYQSHLDKGQEVLGLGANPSFCSTPVVGHSHQASLVDVVSNRSLGVHSTTQSQMHASALPTAGSPMPEIGRYQDDDEITNPSEIQGPGPQNWEMEGMTQGQQLANIATKSARGTTTSPGGKDEGYMSAAHVFSSGMGSPMNTPGPINHLDGIDALDDVSDYDGRANFDHRLSMGQSHGMPSPLYDSATGRGIENIKSKDIIALMDHLTVRDAQRNARDTEILVSLVRSAAEMRNYFEDLKKQLDEKSKEIITEVDKSTERHVNRIQGPRPLPPSQPRTRKAIEEDEQTKKVNVFKRAMKGLGGKNNGDLQRIEGMLETLLAEMDALKGNHEFYQQSMSQTLDNIKKESQDKTIGGQDQQGLAMATPQTTNMNQQQQLLGPNQGYMDIHYNHNISPIPEGSITPTMDAPVIEPHSRTPPLISDLASPTSKEKKRDPKVSRWSETTASTGIRSFFTRGKKRDSTETREQTESLDDWFGGSRGHQDGDAMPEKSNRISLDLQQPVPRPPLRHQQLEMSAQDYTPTSAPISPTSYKSTGSFNKYPYGTVQPMAALPMTPEGYTLSGSESYAKRDGEEKPKKERRKKDRSSREYDPEREARRAARRERKEAERREREAQEQQDAENSNPQRNASTASRLNGPRPNPTTYEYQEPLVDAREGGSRRHRARMSTGENY